VSEDLDARLAPVPEALPPPSYPFRARHDGTGRARVSEPEEYEEEGPSEQHRPIDWRGWIILAWVVWFSLLYGKMVVEQRGGMLRRAIAHFAKGNLEGVWSPVRRGSPGPLP
jgi:hypothetical protein